MAGDSRGEAPPSVGQVLKYLWQLSLPEFWMVSIFPVYIGYVLGSKTMVPSVESVLGIIIMGPLIMGSTLMLNEYYDREIDLKNPRKAKSPLVRGLVEPENAFRAAVALMALGFMLGLVISPAFAVVVFAAILLSLAYSVPAIRFKALPGADLYVNAVGLGVLCPLAGYFTVANPAVPFPYPFLAVSLTGLGAAYIPTTMMDYDVDREAGIHSLSVKLGRRRAWALGVGFIAASIGTIVALGVLDAAPFSRAVLERIAGLLAATVGLYAWFVRRMDYRTYWTYIALITLTMGINILLWLLWYTGVWVL